MSTVRNDKLSQIVSRGDSANQPPPRPVRTALVPMNFEDLWRFAEAAAASKLFPNLDSAAKVFTLMMLAHSKGLHFMSALERYDLIEGKPGLKSIALAADFKDRGWSWKVEQLTDTVASASFYHPTRAPEPFFMEVRIEDLKHLTSKSIWTRYPRKMLWWRLVSLVVDVMEPGIKAGLPAAEEFEEVEEAAPFPAAVDPPRGPAREALPAREAPDRSYIEIFKPAVSAANGRVKELGGGKEIDVNLIHAYMIQELIDRGLAERPSERKASVVLKSIAKAYRAHPDEVTRILSNHLDELVEEASRVRADEGRPAELAPDPDDYGGEVAVGREPGEDG